MIFVYRFVDFLAPLFRYKTSPDNNKIRKFLAQASKQQASFFVVLARDDSKYGYDSGGQNFYLKNHHEFQKMVLISFKDL